MDAPFSRLPVRLLGIAAMLLSLTCVRAQNTGSPPAADTSAKIPQLIIVGDSTANSSGAVQGWGTPFAKYFDPAKIQVLNRARGGRSSKTFLLEGLWDNVVSEIQPGDIVLIQFGQNDGSPLNDTKARGSLPGLGDETKDVTLPNGIKQTVHTFGWYMRKYIADTQAKGAHPIVLTLTVRNIWPGNTGKVEHGPGNYSLWSAEVAKSQNVPLIDLTSLIARDYEKMGAKQVKTLFGADTTHTNPAGAEINASFVVAGLKALPGHPVDSYLSPKGKIVPAAPASAVIVPAAHSNARPAASAS